MRNNSGRPSKRRVRKLFFGMTFIGQNPLVRRARKLAAGGRNLGERFAHSLLIGPSGLGKTSFARFIGELLGVTVRTYFAGPDCNTAFWAIASRDWRAFDVIFVDEVHRLQDAQQEVLYPVLDRGQVPVLSPDADGGRPRVTGARTIEHLCLIAATDQPGKLTKAFRERIQETFHFENYTKGELKQIISESASSANVLLSRQALGVLAHASCGNPRNALKLLRSLRHIGSAQEVKLELKKSDVLRMLRLEGIRPDGLTTEHFKYMKALFQRQNLGLRALSFAVGVDLTEISRGVEPYLISEELVVVERAGRRLTEKGRAYLEGIQQELRNGEEPQDRTHGGGSGHGSI